MLSSVILFSVVVSAFGGSLPTRKLSYSDGHGRIVGGSVTTIERFPWQVSLQEDGHHICGGSIYSTDIIVTAAHCLESINDVTTLKVRAGSSYWQHDGVLVNVKAFKIHENYDDETTSNDVAIIKLSSPLTYGSSIKAISLATIPPANGAPASVSGWGSLSDGFNIFPNVLQFVNINIVSQSECASSKYEYGREILPDMICAAASDKDSCSGDSGGPLVSNGVLVGIVSWGGGCADPDYPGVYSDVSYLRPWIINAIDSI